MDSRIAKVVLKVGIQNSWHIMAHIIKFIALNIWSTIVAKPCIKRCEERQIFKSWNSRWGLLFTKKCCFCPPNCWLYSNMISRWLIHPACFTQWWFQKSCLETDTNIKLKVGRSHLNSQIVILVCNLCALCSFRAFHLPWQLQEQLNSIFNNPRPDTIAFHAYLRSEK
jgi:hypothetical protein